MGITRIVSLLSIVSTLGFSVSASAAVFYLDQFSVTRNGALIFNDTFDAGGPPPQAPNFSNGNSASYLVQGTMGPELGGKLTLNPAQDGILIPNLAGNPDNLVQKATLQTNINPSVQNGLKQGEEFSIQAIYDLVSPDVVTREGYGIRFEDFGGSTLQPGNDVYEIALRRLANNDIAIRFRELDFLNDVIIDINDYILSASDLLNQQIKLQLGTVGTSNNIQAGYAFGNGGVFGAINYFSGTGSIFTGENYTRGVIIARTAPAQVPLPATVWLFFAGLGALGLSRRLNRGS